MIPNKIKVACVVMLLLGLAIGPVSALAQKSGPVSTEKVNRNTNRRAASISSRDRSLDCQKHCGSSDQSGEISRIEEVINVKGVGEKKFQKIKDRLVVQRLRLRVFESRRPPTRP